MMSDPTGAKDYWNKNIADWGKLYLDASHSGETFDVPRWIEYLYHHTITPIEARLMKKRFELTMDFIHEYVRPGMTAVDVGCGTGVFTVEMLRQGASVVAVDRAQNALELTESLVKSLVPEYARRAEYLLADVSERQLPQSHAVLAMGVTPYVENLSDFYGNILPTTRTFCCLVVDPEHWANVVRKHVSILNVRKLHWFDQSLVDSLLVNHGWKLVSRQRLGTGYIDIAAKYQ